ncbi:unnamed protein product [Effrenium voratum]|uniref:Uncharacterized protein n=1 Tax=Effrenium voratum TaxID=2562239 RepID=A0AA36NBH5_9DINO|nr:unnamed protein product [Effrenium voratum]CAJ1423404.1 unnamed protein product [Effrenium voratum]
MRSADCAVCLIRALVMGVIFYFCTTWDDADDTTITRSSTPAPEKELDDLTWTKVVLLISFVVIFLGIVHLVNFPYLDKEVKHEGWQLLTVAISIFSAACLVFAISRVLRSITQGDEVREEVEGTLNFVICVSVFACLAFTALHMVLLSITPTPGNHRKMFAASMFGSHVYAAASVLAFGQLQKNYFGESLSTALAVPCLSIAVTAVLYGLVLLAERSCRFERMPVQLVKDAQIEAGAIAAAFLVVQALCYAMSEEQTERFTPVIHGPPGAHHASCVLSLFGSAAVLIVFSAMWSVCLRPRCRHMPFVLDFVSRLASVTGCWCLQRGGIILFYKVFMWKMSSETCDENHCTGRHRINLGHASNRATVVNALAMSLLAAGFIFLTDCCEPCDESDPTDLGLYNASPGMRMVVDGFGLLVGIVWAKAFQTAYSVLDRASIEHLKGQHSRIGEFVGDNPITASVTASSVGIVVSMCVLVAWYHLIVPHAMKHAEAEERARLAQSSDTDDCADSP